MGDKDAKHGRNKLDTGPQNFAMSGTAQTYRKLKAEALRNWCWDHWVTSAEIRRWANIGIQPQPRPALLRGICKAVGVNEPHKGSPTWRMVADGLEAKERWADQLTHRTHPSAHRNGHRPEWLPAIIQAKEAP